MAEVYKIGGKPTSEPPRGPNPWALIGVGAGLAILVCVGLFAAWRALSPATPAPARAAVAATPPQPVSPTSGGATPSAVRPGGGFLTGYRMDGNGNLIKPPSPASPVSPGASLQPTAATQPGVMASASVPAAGGGITPPQASPAPVQPAVTTQDVIARVKLSVVLLIAEEPDGVASGTGFVVGPGQIGTCAHVIENARRIAVVTQDGRVFTGYGGAMDAANDVAVVRCNESLPPALTLGDDNRSREGDELAVTGYPVVSTFVQLGFRANASTSRGTVSGKQVRTLGSGQQVPCIQTDAAINPGNSGGPVYSTRDGAVIGLAQSMLTHERGISFASSINALKRLLGRW